MRVHVGVDVGGTNTDAVVVFGKSILAAVKCVTTEDVTSGVSEAVKTVLARAREKEKDLNVSRVHIGTTHFVNAVVQRRHVVKVGVIRLCRPASTSLPPFSDFPEDLKHVLCGGVFLLSGGHQFDGERELSEPNKDEMISALHQLKEDGTSHVVINAIFSPVNPKHELWARDVIQKQFPEISITLSHQVGHMGLLERENAAILNESLKPLCQETIAAFRQALDNLELTCPFYLTQNDGTLINAEQTLAMPVHTFASGPTNSMRGAAFLSGVQDAVVVDIGGTSTDVGVLLSGFPREASTEVEVGGVRTNFRMPDVPSIGLGGGSLVSQEKQGDTDKVQVGPLSVGYRLCLESLVFGGDTFTASDAAVAAGLTEMGDKSKVAGLDPKLVSKTVDKWHTMLEDLIDSVKTSEEDIPVILVGGGSVLIDSRRKLKGISKLIKPAHYQVANAVGAALSQVSGYVDKVVSLTETTRDDAIAKATGQAKQEAVQAGANPSTLKVVEVSDTPLSYLPGNATKLKIKVVGDLVGEEDCSETTAADVVETVTQDVFGVVHDHQNPPQAQQEKTKAPDGAAMHSQPTQLKESDQTKPFVDPKTGEWVLSEWDIECIAVGAGILGCGGGGSPHIGKLRALRAIREGKIIRVVTPERITETMCDGDIVVPVGFMGAPVILTEKITNGREPLNALQCLMEMFKHGQYHEGTLNNPGSNIIEKGDGISNISDFSLLQMEESGPSEPILGPNAQLVGVMAFEIGGLNSVEPLLVGAELGLPVVDCDGMGRAFPELQMYTPVIYGGACYPGCLSDEFGNVSAVLHAETPKHVENYYRAVCIKYGCSAGIAWTTLKRMDFTDKVIPHSLSRAWHLGEAVLQAGRIKADPVKTILDHEGGKILITGKICDVKRETTGGFNKGRLKIVGLGEFNNQTLLVDFQNENLVATVVMEDMKQKVLACTPDLISVVVTETGVPVPTEEVRYGLRVSVLGLCAPPILRTPQALTFVGPQAFGYPASEVEYSPLGNYVHHQPVPSL